MNLDGIPAVAEQKGIELKNLAEEFMKLHTMEELEADKSFIRLAPFMMLEMAETNRFGNSVIRNYVNEIVTEAEQQFAAVEIVLEDGTSYVSFRGTDDTIIGWKEDFNLSTGVVPAQERAVEYVRRVSENTSGMLRVGGHSKGGNLALVGAMRATVLKKMAIKEIYSFDGPGLRENEFTSLNYKLVRNKLHTIIPNESLVGVLFNQENLDVIKSDEIGIMQHAATSWQVSGDKFLRTTKSTLSDNLDKAIYDWLTNYDIETRKLIIDETFGLLEKSNIKRVSDISDNYLKSLFEILKASKTLDNQTKVVIFNCLKLLSTTLSKTLINMELAQLKKKINFN